MDVVRTLRRRLLAALRWLKYLPLSSSQPLISCGVLPWEHAATLRWKSSRVLDVHLSRQVGGFPPTSGCLRAAPTTLRIAFLSGQASFPCGRVDHSLVQVRLATDAVWAGYRGEALSMRYVLLNSGTRLLQGGLRASRICLWRMWPSYGERLLL